MQVSVDWFSFTLPLPSEPPTAFQAFEAARRAIINESAEASDLVIDGQGWNSRRGRAPYTYGFERDDSGCFIFIGSNTGTVLIEVTGRGCEPMRDYHMLYAVMRDFGTRCTRIDIACDMATDVRPADFSNKRSKGKGMSVGFIKSPTGETVYVGSQKSERYCRVYRYDPPHPRAAFLRFEAVYRRDYAKALCEVIADGATYASIAKTVGQRYGWQHEAWYTGDAEALDLSLPRPARHLNKTVTWLMSSCVPALARCLEARAIDWGEFCDAVDKAAQEYQ